ncbi:ASG_G0003020.mRNA.1.CDS.1 [Saccharomyces cerevisiae]|nr:ASG_G0003020.mRNA.1.CDS.1 [Saccharomyces cerevisiae]CAI7044364.1 ASG_G0003020.mRNA.1.CDS.1 [Saccharomyces cerevisiae]
MSFFLNSLRGNQEVSQEKLDVAGVQFDAMCSTFNNILSTCLEKCIPHEGFGEPDLTKGEQCCIDRCVAKMHYSNRLIGGFVQTRGFGPENQLRHYSRFVAKEKADDSKK